MSTFSEQFKQEIRDRVSLAEVVGRKVKLIRRGREMVGLCPFHSEKSPSFSVVEDKQFFHCFGCGAHGDVIGFVMRNDGLSFPDAMEMLAGIAGLTLPVDTPQEAARARVASDLGGVLEAACHWFEQQLRSVAGRAGLDYLHRRGLDDETIRRFRLGFAPDGRGLLRTALGGQGVGDALLQRAGLIGIPEDGRPPYDYFRGRVIFPITDIRGRVIAFGGRGLGDEKPKYLNSPESPVFDKGRTLYGLALARPAMRESGRAIVAEGYMDVIALHRAGFTEAVAPLGTALSEAQIELLWRVAPPDAESFEPIACFDGDPAGQRAAIRAAERALPLLRPGRSLRFARLPAGEDPDTLVAGGGAAAVAAVLTAAESLFDLLWRQETEGRDLAAPERRAALEARMMARAARIVEPTVRRWMERAVRDRLWQAVRADRDATRRPAGGRGRPGGERASPAGRRFAARGPDRGNGWSGERLQAGDPGILAQREQEQFLAAILEHPDLLDDVAELLGSETFDDARLDALKDAILHVEPKSLDTSTLRCHLSRCGFAEALDRIMDRPATALPTFARAGLSIEEVRARWMHAWRTYRQRRSLAEFGELQRRCAEEPTDENLVRMERHRELMQAETRDLADLDRRDNDE